MVNGDSIEKWKCQFSILFRDAETAETNRRYKKKSNATFKHTQKIVHHTTRFNEIHDNANI